jgi:branched-chain amino acid aminotransferase
MAEIKFIKNENLKEKPVDSSKLGFGKLFTDYMFTYRYSEERGWHDAKIEPFAPIPMHPATSCLHYGQAAFEGLKAYKNKDGQVRLFRPKDNIKRMNRGAERLCMPQLPEDVVYEGLLKLVELEKDWIPTDPGTSLYIRPTYIATEEALGVHASKSTLFYIILSPSGPYYAQGLKPVKIFVEDSYVRAVVGGVGHTKAAGNYAASILAGEIAASKGYTQVLWLDGVEHKYVEEVGAMNMFFVIDGVIKTPPLLGSILPGITRDSIIKLASGMGYNVSEERIAIEDVVKASREGRLNEAFGTGTAAVVSPVGELHYEGEDIVINGGEMGEITQKLYDNLTGIQTGSLEDKRGWSVKL